MPGKLDIMDIIRDGLDDLCLRSDDGWTEWTIKVKAKLCEIGHRLRYYVCASQLPGAECSEWLYDMTWLEYTDHTVGSAQTSGWLVDVPLVAECEWSGVQEIEDDFSKLLLARASVRLMVCYDRHPNGPHGMAEQLAEFIQRFNGTRAEDVYMLAVLSWNDDEGSFRFRYFKLGLNGIVMRSWRRDDFEE